MSDEKIRELVDGVARLIDEGAYTCHGLGDVQGLEIAYDSTRVWINIGGRSVLRAKVWEGALIVEFTPPEDRA